MSERASRIVRDIGAVYAINRIREPRTIRIRLWVLPVIVAAATAIGGAVVALVDAERPPVIVNCSQVVKMPDAQRPGWYCIPEGEEG